MANDPDNEPVSTGEQHDAETAEPDRDESDLEVQVEAYDLDEDGKISIVEMERAKLGIVDAHMEELAEQDGVKGKLAGAAHKVLDKLDNDE